MTRTPAIPTAADLGSDRIPVRAGTMWSPPGLTNFLGTVQVDRDVTAVRAMYAAPLWAPEVGTGHLYVDGRFVAGTGATLHVTWYPDAIVREVELDDLRIVTTTFMAVGRAGVVVQMAVTTTGPDRSVTLGLRTDSQVRREVLSLREPFPPGEPDNEVALDQDRVARIATARETGAVMVQGLVGDGAALAGPTGDLEIALDVTTGAAATAAFVVSLGDDADAALAIFDDLAADVDGARTAARVDWDAELAAIVTPGNDRYSGHLPVLETDDEALWRLYWTGILGVVVFKRDNPASVLGRTWDTLMPRFWPTITFLWDYMLSSGTHALLDPAPMKVHLEHWMQSDVHTCMGTCWLTGEGVGMWYAVNDYAMIRLVDDYVRWSGDTVWLTTPLADGRTPLDHVVTHAQSWRDFQTEAGLADYGGIGNLLECVSTYVHEVASLNAANAWGLRTAATLVERHGTSDAAARPDDLRAEADLIVKRLRDLYVDGEGHFVARFPDQRRVPVRHCYDLLTVLDTIPDDLADVHDELVAHWDAEFRTDRWMRALSIRDRDAPFSVRADHQWNGAYTAWPSEVAAGLYRIGRGDRAAGWLRTMAASTNQGPFGQAHFAEGVVEPVGEGARKVPPEEPYINDWACSSGGSWVELVINGIFGVSTEDDTITASPQLSGFDGRSRLRGLTHHGRSYDVGADGLTPGTDA